MPIYKYKTFKEAERALWHFAPDKQYYEKVAELWEFANELNPIVYPRGVFKFKTIEKANKHRIEIEIRHAKMLQMERKCRETEKGNKEKVLNNSRQSALNFFK